MSLDIQSVAVIGAGIMGRGIAQVLAAGGASVTLFDTRPGAVADASAFVGQMLDRAVERAFARHLLDPDRLALGGFSDGASYALSVGLANGELFRRVLAFSPGFMAVAPLRGRPRIFVSHGRADDVLPIGPCSRRLVPSLRRAGYEVDYREFAGGHCIPADLALEALGALAVEEDGSSHRADPAGG